MASRVSSEMVIPRRCASCRSSASTSSGNLIVVRFMYASISHLSWVASARTATDIKGGSAAVRSPRPATAPQRSTGRLGGATATRCGLLPGHHHFPRRVTEPGRAVDQADHDHPPFGDRGPRWSLVPARPGRTRSAGHRVKVPHHDVHAERRTDGDGTPCTDLDGDDRSVGKGGNPGQNDGGIRATGNSWNERNGDADMIIGRAHPRWHGWLLRPDGLAMGWSKKSMGP